MSTVHSCKSVLITGAAGALGSVTASRFLQAGCKVLAVDHPGKTRDLPGAQWIGMDITNPSSVREQILKASQSFGPIDGLVHCAGGFRFSRLDQLSDADLDFLINVNLKSSFYLVRELLPQMKKQNFGRMVFVSARATLQAGNGMGAYAASKAGINMLVSSLAEEVRAHDICVNAVMPTIIDTPANRADMPAADYSKWVKADDLAEVIFSLTQSLGNPIHGALIPVSGRL